MRYFGKDTVERLGLTVIDHEKYPDIRVRVRQTGDKQMRALIDAGEVDLAFLSTAYPAKGSFLPLHSTAIICLAPKDYVPANGVSVTPDDLEGQHLILQLEGYDTEMIMWVHDNNVNVRTDCKIEVDSTCHEHHQDAGKRKYKKSI